MSRAIQENDSDENSISQVNSGKQNEVLARNNFMISYLENDLNKTSPDMKAKTKTISKTTAYLASIVGSKDSVIDD